MAKTKQGCFAISLYILITVKYLAKQPLEKRANFSGG